MSPVLFLARGLARDREIAQGCPRRLARATGKALLAESLLILLFGGIAWNRRVSDGRATLSRFLPPFTAPTALPLRQLATLALRVFVANCRGGF